MTKIERLKKLCKWLIYIGYADNDTDLASKLGYTKSSFSQIINGKVPISDKFIDKICATDEDINKVWISSGDGQMINSLQELSNDDYNYKELADSRLEVITLLKDKISILNNTIENLKKPNFPKGTVEYLNEPPIERYSGK